MLILEDTWILLLVDVTHIQEGTRLVTYCFVSYIYNIKSLNR
jgi:hypothetical protein